MVTRVTEDIYNNEIFLPNTPLKALNCYIIHSKGEALVIDTGFDMDVCYDAFLKGFEEIGVPVENAHLVVTHLHADHTGLCSRLEPTVKSIMIGEHEAEEIERLASEDPELGWERVNTLKTSYDLDKYSVSLDDNPAYTQMYKTQVDFKLLKEGDKINIGDYAFEVIHTPGHTPGHICLYEREKKIFASGDHVLGKITPNISHWGDSYGDSLGTYLKSLDKIADLNVELVLSSHRYRPESLKQRVEELKAHHARRLSEVVDILEKGGKQTVSKVASQMTWDLKARNWDDFPRAQKWFATAEAMSHLYHLAQKGVTRRTQEGALYMFELV